MEQLSLYPDYIGVSHWHDDVEFIMMMDGQMTYDINGQNMTCRPGKVSLSTADACTMDTQHKNVENSYDLLSLTAII
ncbi:AraC family ligand binding domain-containing protein [Coprococcus aceti]|uniref:AraC family ligand binding domain-containing protein n=1 Tax=Coprococcus aceti TaxID=2981786 RepID=UPI0022E83CCD|nr:AraC family ligand binding domain-containing protein [Coprococcus aceti]